MVGLGERTSIKAKIYRQPINMKQDRPNTQVVLIDIQYHDSINAFECWYGEHISYQEIEQRSYIEFKEIMFSNICREIKFRKYGRIGQVLTLKVDMLKHEIENFKKLLETNNIKLTHNWIISNITIIKDGNFNSNKKMLDDEEDVEINTYEDLEEF